VRGALGHPTAPATRTEAAPLTRKRDEPIEAAVAAAKSRESGGQAATAEKAPELLFDEPREAFAVSKRGGLHAKRFEMFEHDLVERTLLGTPRFVGGREIRHAIRVSRRRASD
jgi:hypothetical protein